MRIQHGYEKYLFRFAPREDNLPRAPCSGDALFWAREDNQQIYPQEETFTLALRMSSYAFK